MAIAGALKVDCGDAFPHGLGVISEVDSLDDFDKSSKESRVQARDKETGLLMWSVEVLDFDPQAREKTFRVKIGAAQQPVPPEAISGAPVRPGGPGRTHHHALHQGRAAAEDRLLAALHRPVRAGSPG